MIRNVACTLAFLCPMKQIMPQILSPDDPALDELCAALRTRADALDIAGNWPAEQLRLCAEYGVYRWFLPEWCGGLAWSEADVLRGYWRLGAACLITTFILTQRTGACRRIADSDNRTMHERWLPGLAEGSLFATVGISHLTTSRRHLQRPAMCARPTTEGFVLDGFSPWVTGADTADCIVTGGTLDEENSGQGPRQILVALPTDTPGVHVDPPERLVGLAASHTGQMRCEAVAVPQKWVLAGPLENVMAAGKGAGTGGLQTSTLALGLATAALDFLAAESERRLDLAAPTAALRAEVRTTLDDLLATADGVRACSSEDLRSRANNLAMRTTQAALTAAKGSGYVVGHPAGRWCREALFFLVWSCPQPELNATLCELAGLE